MNDVNRIKTPNGGTLGERVNVDGKSYIKHKSGKIYDVLSPEAIAELITGCKVKKIIYES